MAQDVSGRKKRKYTKTKEPVIGRFNVRCTVCGKSYKVPHCRLKKTKYCSYACMGIGNARRGEGSHLWKGGITPLSRMIRTMYEYRQWRSDVYTRDDYTCVMCGKRGGRLNADHIVLFSDILYRNNVSTLQEAKDCGELWNINNGQTICYECHASKTSKDLSRKYKGLDNRMHKNYVNGC